MLNSGKKNILTLVFEKTFLNETKNHNPPCELNGRSLNRLAKFKIDRIVCVYLYRRGTYL